MTAPITYDRAYLGSDAPDSFFDYLWAELPWEHRGGPRRECWLNPYGEPYTYGSGEHARTYQAHLLNRETMWSYTILRIMQALNHAHGASFDCCFVNGYEHNRQHLGWHSDDSPEMDMGHPIAVVSLGAAREIWFRKRRDAGWGYNPFDENDSTFATEKLLLRHGSALIMHAGMQRYWQHRIPKSAAACGPHISLTYRRLVRG